MTQRIAGETPPGTPRGAAHFLEPLLTKAFGGSPPIRLRAWDGSETGPAAAPAVVLRDPAALRRLVRRPDELGLARAYVAGELEVEGELAEGLARVRAAIGERPSAGAMPGRFSARDWAYALRVAAAFRVLGPEPPAPAAEARMSGRRNSQRRDARAIAHHYNLSNAFYELVLDPQLVYSCGYWTSDAPGYGLADAQRDKLDLICRKLALEPGMRLLDLGCGWGSLAIHAAQHYGAHVTAVTLSRRQLEFVRERVAGAGLGDRVEARCQDYRDLDERPFDAAASVEMGEHVGARNYTAFAKCLHTLLRPRGRLLLQQMSRHGAAPGGGPFIEAYIAPDMHMRPLGETTELLERTGLEVRDVHALREHYVRTARAWSKTLEQRWEEAVDMVGVEQARVWRLYLAGGALAFAQGRMGVDQILAVRPGADGGSGMPTTRTDYGV